METVDSEAPLCLLHCALSAHLSHSELRDVPSTPALMASREHPRSLAELSEELLAIIASRVGATSNRPMEDLRSLRATRKSMFGPCHDRDVGRLLALDRVPVEQMQNDNPDGYDVFIPSLAEAGNPVACFLTGMDDIFGRNHSPRPPLDQLHHAAEGGPEGRPMWPPSSSTGPIAGPTLTPLQLRT